MDQRGQCFPCLRLSAIMIGMLSLVSNIGAIIVSAEMIRHGSRNRPIAWDVAIIVVCSMQMALALPMILGVYKRSQNLILPCVTFQLVLVVLCVAAIFVELHLIQLVYIAISLALWSVVILHYAALRKQSSDIRPVP